MCKTNFYWLRSTTICFSGSVIFSVLRTTDLSDGGGRLLKVLDVFGVEVSGK